MSLFKIELKVVQFSTAFIFTTTVCKQVPCITFFLIFVQNFAQGIGNFSSQNNFKITNLCQIIIFFYVEELSWISYFPI